MFEQRAAVQCETAAVNTENMKKKPLGLLYIKQFQKAKICIIHLDASLATEFDLTAFSFLSPSLVLQL